MGENVQRIPVAEVSWAATRAACSTSAGSQRRGQTQRDGEFRAEAMNHVEPKNNWDMQTRLFNCNVLECVGLLRSRDVEQGADLAAGDEVFVVGTSGARSGRLTWRILDQLADLLFQRHLAQKIFYFGIETGVIHAGAKRQAGIWARRAFWVARGCHNNTARTTSAKLSFRIMGWDLALKCAQS